MAYAAPDLADFTARFPSFAGVSNDTYALWSADAAAITGAKESCLGDRIDLATMYLTAHYLTGVGIGTGAESEMAAQGAAGFKAIRSGSLSLERAEESGADAGQFGTTSWGRQFWAMFRGCVSGPLVTGTGCLPYSGGFNGYAGPLPPWGH